MVLLTTLTWGACRQQAVYRPSKEEALKASQEIIRAQLLSPGYILFSNQAEMTIDELDPGHFRVRGFVDYKGRSGMAIRTNYTCVLRYNTRGQWEVEDLKLE